MEEPGSSEKMLYVRGGGKGEEAVGNNSSDEVTVLGCAGIANLEERSGNYDPLAQVPKQHSESEPKFNNSPEAMNNEYPGDNPGDNNDDNAKHLDRIINEKLPPIKEVDDNSSETDKAVNDDQPIMALGYGELYKKVRMLYFSSFSAAGITPALEPNVPFVACDMAKSDTNFFAWFKRRRYHLLESISLMWKERKKWKMKRIWLFKRSDFASFKFQAGSDVIRADTEQEANEQWFDFMKRFCKSRYVMEVNIEKRLVSINGYDYVELLSDKEKMDLKSQLEADGTLSGDKVEKVELVDICSLSRVMTSNLPEYYDFEPSVNPVEFSNPVTIDPSGGDEELQELESRDKFGESVNNRTPEQIEEDKREIRQALLESIDKLDLNKAQKNAISRVLMTNEAAFALEQAQCRMSRLVPIKAYLKPNSPPISQKARTMSFEKLEFLKGKIEDLVRIGMLRPSPNPQYGSPVFVVPKKGNRWRMVVDLRLLNKHTQKTPLDLPHLENQLQHLGDSGFYSSFDVVSGFDFLPVERASQHIFTVTTPFGAYEMCGAPMGWTNTPQLFSSRILQEVLSPTGLFCRPNNGILQWIDDSLLYANSFDKLLEMMHIFLQQIIHRGLRLNVRKCEFFTRRVEFCGRIISRDGWTFKDKFWATIRDMPRPQKISDLAQAVHVAQWLSVSVPGFAEVREKLDRILGDNRGKPKKLLKAQGTNITWTQDAITAWNQFKTVLEAASRQNMAHYDHSKEILLLTDASKHFWSGVVMQVDPIPEDQKKINLADLKAKPLMFMSGKFRGSQTRWHISQRELYPIVHSFYRFDFLLLNSRKTVNIVTDHSALQYILDPTLAKNKTHAERLSRWALCIQQVRTRVFHNPGTQHQFADLLSRWGYSEPKTSSKLEDKSPEIRVDSMDLAATRSEITASMTSYTIDYDYHYLDSLVTATIEESITWFAEEAKGIAFYNPNWQPLTSGVITELIQCEHALKRTSSSSTLSSSNSSITPVSDLELNDFNLDCRNHLYNFDDGLAEITQTDTILESGDKNSLNDSDSDSSSNCSEIVPVPIDFDQLSGIDNNRKVTMDVNPDLPGDKPIKLVHEDNIQTHGDNVQVNALSKKRKKQIENFSSELNHFFQKDEISFYSPYYEGDYFLITVDAIRDMQLEDGLISEPDQELKRDNKNRILLSEKRLAHLIVAIHVQNRHVGYARDLEVLGDYHVIGKTRAELKKLLYAYRNLCLHCQRYPHILRQPLNKIVMGRRPRAVLRMDYLFISKQSGHILVIIDTFSRKTFLKHTLSEDAKTAVQGLMEWNAAFGLAENFLLVTDRGSHFANELMAYAVPAFRGKHEMAIPYAPWTNGSVENRNKNILRILRQLCSELSLTDSEWPLWIAQTTSVINNLPIPSRGNKTPNELFLGHKVNSRLTANYKFVNPRKLILDKDNEDILALIAELQTEWIKLHEDAKYTYKEIDLARSATNHRKNSGLEVIQYRPGDWVLYSNIGKPQRRNKLQPVWQGPFRVVDVVGNNVYEIADVFGNKHTVHASRIWFYNTSDYYPKKYVEKLFFQHWVGLDIQEITDVGQDENGNLQVLVSFLGFPDDDPTECTIEQVLDGAHLLLSQYIEDNKSNLREDLYQAFRDAIDAHMAKIASIEVSTDQKIASPNLTSASDPSFFSLNLPTIGADDQDRMCPDQERRFEGIPDHDRNERILEAEQRVFPSYRYDAHDVSLNNNTRNLTVTCDYPTYVKGWTAAEVTTLRRLLQFLPRGKWDVIKSYLPSKTMKQIRYKAKALRPIKRRPLDVDEKLAVTLHRDLRKTIGYQRKLATIQQFLEAKEDKLKEAINAKDSKFCSYTLREDIPNYFTTEDFIYRHQPLNSHFRRGFVEELTIRDVTDYPRIDILYRAPPWGSGMDFGRPELSLFAKTLRDYPANVIGVWVVSFVLVDVLKLLEDNGYEIDHQLDWIKLTSRGNLLKTRGFYLQHSKETLLVARRVPVTLETKGTNGGDKNGKLSPELTPGEITTKSRGAKKEGRIETQTQSKNESKSKTSQTKRENKVHFVMERQRLAGSKPMVVAELLEQWFPTSGPKVELYARHNNMRTGWFSVGTELNGPGLHAVMISAASVPPSYRPI